MKEKCGKDKIIDGSLQLTLPIGEIPYEYVSAAEQPTIIYVKQTKLWLRNFENVQSSHSLKSFSAHFWELFWQLQRNLPIADIPNSGHAMNSQQNLQQQMWKSF